MKALVGYPEEMEILSIFRWGMAKRGKRILGSNREIINVSLEEKRKIYWNSKFYKISREGHFFQATQVLLVAILRSLFC